MTIQRSLGEKSTKAKRVDYVEDWDEYFLGIALAVAKKSKDPRCQVGAVVVSGDRVLLSSGFNGLARGVWDVEELLANVDEKLKWICHAEHNAILNAVRTGVSLVDSTIYVNKFPCFACCIAIAQAGIKRICTQDDWYWNDDPLDADHSRKRALLKQTGIRVDAPLHPDFVPLKRFSVNGNVNGTQGEARADSPEPTPSGSSQLDLPQLLATSPALEERLAKVSGRRRTQEPRKRHRHAS